MLLSVRQRLYEVALKSPAPTAVSATNAMKTRHLLATAASHRSKEPHALKVSVETLLLKSLHISHAERRSNTHVKQTELLFVFVFVPPLGSLKKT